MAGEDLCPICGAPLKPGQPCPFCSEARRLVAQLADKDEVRLCARCGEILRPDEEDICAACRQPAQPRFVPLRTEDGLTRWIRDRFVEPATEQAFSSCPSCGEAAPPLALFCPYCGRKLVRPPASSPGVETAAGEMAPAEAPPPAGPAPVTATAEPAAAAGLRAVLPVEADRGAVPGGPAPPVASPPASAGFPLEGEPGEAPAPPGEPASPPVPRSSPRRSSKRTPAWFWIMLAVVFLALIGMVLLWVYLLQVGIQLH